MIINKIIFEFILINSIGPLERQVIFSEIIVIKALEENTLPSCCHPQRLRLLSQERVQKYKVQKLPVGNSLSY